MMHVNIEHRKLLRLIPADKKALLKQGDLVINLASIPTKENCGLGYSFIANTSQFAEVSQYRFGFIMNIVGKER